eukprot:3599791-Pleurochrysis_carterae.AAC.3
MASSSSGAGPPLFKKQKAGRCRHFKRKQAAADEANQGIELQDFMAGVVQDAGMLGDANVELRSLFEVLTRNQYRPDAANAEACDERRAVIYEVLMTNLARKSYSQKTMLLLTARLSLAALQAQLPRVFGQMVNGLSPGWLASNHFAGWFVATLTHGVPDFESVYCQKKEEALHSRLLRHAANGTLLQRPSTRPAWVAHMTYHEPMWGVLQALYNDVEQQLNTLPCYIIWTSASCSSGATGFLSCA